MARRNAIIVAAAVEVQCPHCGAPQPAPSGSHIWELHEVKSAEDRGVRVCMDCDTPFRILFQTRVSAEG